MASRPPRASLPAFAATSAHEQLGPELALEAVEPRGAGRLGEPKDVRGAADAAAAIGLDECLDLTQLHRSDIGDFYIDSKSIGLFYVLPRAYDAKDEWSWGGNSWPPRST
jgi:hypothetical protein